MVLLLRLALFIADPAADDTVLSSAFSEKRGMEVKIHQALYRKTDRRRLTMCAVRSISHRFLNMRRQTDVCLMHICSADRAERERQANAKILAKSGEL